MVDDLDRFASALRRQARDLCPEARGCRWDDRKDRWRRSPRRSNPARATVWPRSSKGPGAQRPVPEALMTPRKTRGRRSRWNNISGAAMAPVPPPLPPGGSATAVALPLLDAMTAAPRRLGGTVSEKPRRSVFVYIPNGVNGIDLAGARARSAGVMRLSPSLRPLGEVARRVHGLQRPAPSQRASARPTSAPIRG